ncbi:23S rRNA (guanine745-N1)-methyltransferase [Alkalibacterium subtropicum]|uniref:23S rRNA (Guanine745-N1)-methyltransferase n=1 Tax=Alkalibacterium subtropicum TaxID=753702 RepID=A0A1I1J0P9_9LACT|nr:methyltransferase domain-containing protein [Alkalibacterium subtropicum]SFC42056.1 23S rRNA (guanine745-N1)-methyltransferase [Alkalibacterium subtropicum]
MKKIDKAKLFILDHLHLFRCPVCERSFEKMEGNQLVCTENHAFDLSKKGTLHFLLKPSKSEYSREMLLARQRIAQMGFWQPMLDILYPLIEAKDGVTLDVGCGEGAHSAYLKEKGLHGPVVAFDISKEGVNLGAATYEDIFFLVADLAQSPFQAEQFDALLNILSPSNYEEFYRLLKPGGQVIKVIPGKDYLKELRAYQPEEKRTYSNQDVKDKFTDHYSESEIHPVHYKVDLTDEEVSDFLKMTPLGWNINVSDTNTASLKQITVDMEILVGNKSK